MGEFVSDITGRNDSVQNLIRCCADSAGACMDGIIRHEPLPHQEMVLVTLQVASSFFPLVFYFEEQSSKQHRQPWVPAAECFLWGVQNLLQSNSRNVISESNEDDLNRVDVLHRRE
ncbi:hypothetical protein OIU78_009586 [Salix suchowensis]|nr:hypothetical protein OIU78_009586 [Salix suchowensis]